MTNRKILADPPRFNWRLILALMVNLAVWLVGIWCIWEVIL